MVRLDGDVVSGLDKLIRGKTGSISLDYFLSEVSWRAALEWSNGRFWTEGGISLITDKP